jgi:hypothetical protein
MLRGISCELASFLHRPIVDYQSTIATVVKPNLSQLNLSRLSLAKPAKLNFFKTPTFGGQKTDLHYMYCVIYYL